MTAQQANRRKFVQVDNQNLMVVLPLNYWRRCTLFKHGRVSVAIQYRKRKGCGRTVSRVQPPDCYPKKILTFIRLYGRFFDSAQNTNC